jgi:hypothetical protein
MGLQIHPTLRIRSEKPGKPQGRIGCNGPFPCNDFSDAPLRHANALGKPVLSDVHGLKEFFPQDFAGMNQRHVSFHGSPSMIIGDFDLMGMILFPGKADPPLVIDSDAPLAFSIPAKFLQAVPPRDPQERQGRGAVNQGQFAQGHPQYVPGQARNKCALKELFRFFAAKKLNHD